MRKSITTGPVDTPAQMWSYLLHLIALRALTDQLHEREQRALRRRGIIAELRDGLGDYLAEDIVRK